MLIFFSRIKIKIELRIDKLICITNNSNNYTIFKINGSLPSFYKIQ